MTSIQTNISGSLSNEIAGATVSSTEQLQAEPRVTGQQSMRSASGERLAAVQPTEVKASTSTDSKPEFQPKDPVLKAQQDKHLKNLFKRIFKKDKAKTQGPQAAPTPELNNKITLQACEAYEVCAAALAKVQEPFSRLDEVQPSINIYDPDELRLDHFVPGFTLLRLAEARSSEARSIIQGLQLKNYPQAQIQLQMALHHLNEVNQTWFENTVLDISQQLCHKLPQLQTLQRWGRDVECGTLPERVLESIRTIISYQKLSTSEHSQAQTPAERTAFAFDISVDKSKTLDLFADKSSLRFPLGILSHFVANNGANLEGLSFSGYAADLQAQQQELLDALKRYVDEPFAQEGAPVPFHIEQMHTHQRENLQPRYQALERMRDEFEPWLQQAIDAKPQSAQDARLTLVQSAVARFMHSVAFDATHPLFDALRRYDSDSHPIVVADYLSQDVAGSLFAGWQNQLPELLQQHIQTLVAQQESPQLSDAQMAAIIQKASGEVEAQLSQKAGLITDFCNGLATTPKEFNDWHQQANQYWQECLDGVRPVDLDYPVEPKDKKANHYKRYSKDLWGSGARSVRSTMHNLRYIPEARRYNSDYFLKNARGKHGVGKEYHEHDCYRPDWVSTQEYLLRTDQTDASLHSVLWGGDSAITWLKDGYSIPSYADTPSPLADARYIQRVVDGENPAGTSEELRQVQPQQQKFFDHAKNYAQRHITRPAMGELVRQNWINQRIGLDRSPLYTQRNYGIPQHNDPLSGHTFTSKPDNVCQFAGGAELERHARWTLAHYPTKIHPVWQHMDFRDFCFNVKHDFNSVYHLPAQLPIGKYADQLQVRPIGRTITAPHSPMIEALLDSAGKITDWQDYANAPGNQGYHPAPFRQAAEKQFDYLVRNDDRLERNEAMARSRERRLAQTNKVSRPFVALNLPKDISVKSLGPRPEPLTLESLKPRAPREAELPLFEPTPVPVQMVEITDITEPEQSKEPVAAVGEPQLTSIRVDTAVQLNPPEVNEARSPESEIQPADDVLTDVVEDEPSLDNASISEASAVAGSSRFSDTPSVASAHTSGGDQQALLAGVWSEKKMPEPALNLHENAQRRMNDSKIVDLVDFTSRKAAHKLANDIASPVKGYWFASLIKLPAVSSHLSKIAEVGVREAVRHIGSRVFKHDMRSKSLNTTAEWAGRLANIGVYIASMVGFNALSSGVMLFLDLPHLIINRPRAVNQYKATFDQTRRELEFALRYHLSVAPEMTIEELAFVADTVASGIVNQDPGHNKLGVLQPMAYVAQ